MALQNALQLYNGPLKDLSSANAPVPGIPAWTTDSQELFVSKGGTYVRPASSTKVWTVSSTANLYTVTQAAGGNALVGDIVIDSGTTTPYVLTSYASRVWLATTLYSLGDTLIDSHGNLQTVTTAGVSGGTVPTWSVSGTTTDNEVIWTESAGFVAIASNGTSLSISTNGVLNPVQDILNLVSGSNITVSSDSSGNVTVAATGDLSSAFNDISSGTNTTATMIVGSGATLEPTGTGVINATEINGIPITGTLSHAGQIPISQPGNTSAVWADPLVQGLQAEGTTAATVNPVLVGGKDGSGNLKDLVLDSSGNLAVNVGNFPIQPSVFKTAQATASGNTAIWTPASGKKFRLLKYQIEGTLNIAQSSQGVLTISFQDGTSSITIAHDVYVPSPALKLNVPYSSGWVDLGGTGFLSSAANNVLNVNLSAALKAGNFRINVAGDEE